MNEPRAVAFDRPFLVRWALVAAATAALAFLLLSQVQWAAYARAMGGARPVPLAAAFGIALLFPVLGALRWRLALRSVGEELSFRESLRIVLGCWPIATLTPAKSGDFVRFVALRGRISAASCTASVVAERAADVSCLCLLSAAGLVWLQSRWAGPALGAGVALAGAFFVTVRHLRLPGRAGRFAQALVSALRTVPSHPAAWSGVLGVSLLNWSASVVQWVVLLEAVGARATFAESAAFLPLATFVGLLPVTLAGIGTRDAALLALFAAAGPPAAVLAASTLYTASGYLLLSLLGLPFARHTFGAPTALTVRK